MSRIKGILQGIAWKHTHRQTESERNNERNESKTGGKNNARKMTANKRNVKRT
jgi:hypothetical protein